MVRVVQVMTRDLACIDAAQAVSVAANLMRIRGIGSLLVKRGKEPVGIVTESDILKKVVAFHLYPEFVHVEQIMSSPIASINESDIFEAAGTMKAAHTRHLAVGNESHILGMLSVRDLLAPVAKENSNPWKIIMTRPYPSLFNSTLQQSSSWPAHATAR